MAESVPSQVTIKFRDNRGSPIFSKTYYRESYIYGSTNKTGYYIYLSVPTQSECSGWSFVGLKLTGWKITLQGATYTFNPGESRRYDNLPAEAANLTAYAVYESLPSHIVTIEYYDGLREDSPKLLKTEKRTIPANSSDSLYLPAKKDFSEFNNGHVRLNGWRTYASSGNNYVDWNPGDKFNLYASEDRTQPFYAIVEYDPSYTVRATNGDTEKGTLKFVNGAGNEIEGVEKDGGTLSYVSYDENEYIKLVAEGVDSLYEAYATVNGEKKSLPYTITGAKFDTEIDISVQYEKKPTYSISLDYDESRGSVAVDTAIAETVGGVDKWLKGEVSISVSPKAEEGWKFVQVNFIRDNIVIGNKKELSNGKIVFSLENDVMLKIIFDRERYSCRAGIDDASLTAISSVEVEGGDNEGKISHGDLATYRASVSDGYEFDGWYNGGVLVSTANPYSPVTTSPTTLTAKAKVLVSISVWTEEGEKEKSPALVVDGVACENNSYSEYVVLGNSISYALDIGDWNFDAWYSDGSLAPIGLNGTLKPTRAISLVAKLAANQITRKLTVFAIRVNDGSAIEDPDIITSDVERNPPSSGNSWLGASKPNEYNFTFDGTKYVRVNAKSSIGDIGFNYFAKNVLADGRPDGVLSNENPYLFILNKDVTLYACYGDYVKVDTTFAFASGCGLDNGEIIVEGDDASTDGNGVVTVNRLQQKTITVRVRAKNGYEFVGWYENESRIGDAVSKDVESTFTITNQKTYYAFFERNRHAIFEWEGTKVNKMMEWRSKVYASPVPFNPSAARVDARGYGVELEVGMYSSPDGNPTRKAEIVVKNQDARRLPTLRPERYMQVCVKNDAEVDAVIVGTSMKGLAV